MPKGSQQRESRVLLTVDAVGESRPSISALPTVRSMPHAGLVTMIIVLLARVMAERTVILMPLIRAGGDADMIHAFVIGEKVGVSYDRPLDGKQFTA